MSLPFTTEIGMRTRRGRRCTGRRRHARRPQTAFAADPDPLPVGDAGGNLHGDPLADAGSRVGQRQSSFVPWIGLIEGQVHGVLHVLPGLGLLAARSCPSATVPEELLEHAAAPARPCHVGRRRRRRR